MYNIESLVNLLKQQTPCNDAIENIEKVLGSIASGTSIPHSKREELYNIVMQLKHKSRWGIKEEASKVVEKIRRERLADAQQFYKSYNSPVDQVQSSVDPNHEVEVTIAQKGLTLYQWCKMVIDNKGKATLFDESKGICMIGNYYSIEIVSLSSLGAFRDYDLYNTNGIFVGKAQQVCCRFVLPFSAPCLVTCAKGAFDNWNAKHYHDGTLINEKEQKIGGIKVEKEHYKGIWAHGGATQVFIPLTEAQRFELARHAEFI